MREAPQKIDGFGVVESPETWTWKPAAYAYQSLTHLEDCAARVPIPYIGLVVLSAIIVTTAVRVCWGGIDKFKSLGSRID